jgi:hypothetical protein
VGRADGNVGADGWGGGTLARMPSRVRFVVVGLSLVLFLVLAGLPPPATGADDNVRIDAPANGERVIGKIEVRGRAVTADPARFSFYRLYYGAGSSPSSLRPIASASDKPVMDGVLGTWDTAPLFQGEYTLQLSVYDTAGGTSTTSVVVTVLPAPTPTSRNLPQVLVPPPTPNPDEDTGPPATPLPELPQLIPNIPQIDVPQQNQSAPPIQRVDPPLNDPGYQPIQINPGIPAAPPPQPFDPGLTNPSAPPPTVDLGPAPGSQFNPINPVGPPPVPVIVPNEPPPPTLSLPPTPTLFGIPP